MREFHNVSRFCCQSLASAVSSAVIINCMARAKSRRAQGYTVFQRKDGRWGWAVTIDYHPVTGNPVRRQGICKTQREALDQAIAAREVHRSGKFVPVGKEVRIAEYLQQWMDLYIKPFKEPKTIAYYQGMINTHIVPAFSRVGITKLTAEQVQRLINEKSSGAKPLSANTVRGIKATLSSALGKAYKNGMVTENVTLRVVLPKHTSDQKRHLEEPEAAKLVQAAVGHPLEGFFVFLLHTGLRVGEATGLTWEAVDFDRKVFRVTHQLQRIDGKLQLKGLKTGRSKRTLPMSDSVIQILRAERASQLVSQFGPNTLGLVFLNAEGRPLDPKYVNTQLKKLLAIAGLPSLSVHKLRHTHATIGLAMGTEMHLMKEQLGHSQIALTVNLYGHQVTSALRQNADRFDRIFGQAEDE